MSQPNFAYSAPDAPESEGLPLALSVFADRAHVRAEMRGDAELAGFRVAAAGDVASLLDDSIRPLGEVVLVDCPEVDGARLAALARLDMRVAHSGAQLVVSTSLDALDDVFGCLDQSAPQILIAPSRADRVIALGRVLARAPGVRLRELAEEDRLTLLRLSEQVAQLAQRLGGLDGSAPADGGAFSFESPRPAFAARLADGGDRLISPARAALPDAQLVRQIIRQRQARARFFDGELFADPAWDMLLDLTAARAEHIRVSVTSLCIASGVPPTTALRWIGQMTDAGLFQRMEDRSDRRRAFITLSDTAADAMARYFAQVGAAAPQLV
ncbi:MarR family transcriptional regulator [Novosphingobium sp.]|uniref:MarR family transcriptional regulator n=1 Tax=Novosphingobium sp. TaxID=1874826 RepID=UPI002735BB35|nr:MarR family transcriptional regulator [Novosphingobium sp.]MDP3908719.1 MarR family transcriptional regulator [Novosphingobium sp.]